MNNHFIALDGCGMSFLCTAEVVDGVAPGCWSYIDEDGEEIIGTGCNVEAWASNCDIDDLLRSEVTIPVDVDWSDDEPDIYIIDGTRVSDVGATPPIDDLGKGE